MTTAASRTKDVKDESVEKHENHEKEQKDQKDVYGGLLMAVIGLGALAAGLTHRVGVLGHMGPGYFPVAIGVLLAACGVLVAGAAALRMRASRRAGRIAGQGNGTAGADTAEAAAQHQIALPSTQLPDVRGALCIVAGVLAFQAVARYGGLFPATIAIVFITALGDRKNTLVQAGVLAAAMAVLAAVLFSWALRLQLPLFHWGA